MEKYFDKAVIYAIAQKLWQSLSGALTLFLLLNYVTEVELGYYYAFSSLIGLQMIFELGLSTIVRQFISHEVAKITVKDSYYFGRRQYTNRLSCLIVKSLMVYFVICILIVLILIPAGLYFFSSTTESYDVTWKNPWMLLVIFASINCFITIVVSILEGLGYIARVKKVIFLATIVSSLGVWSTLYFGAPLYSLVILNFVNAIFISIWVARNHTGYFIQAFRNYRRCKSIKSPLSWRKEIWPLQWKMGISWLGGYFMFYIINPLAFKYYGPEFSGKLGLLFQISNLCLSVTAALVTTKMPMFSRMVSLGNISQLDNYFNRVQIISSAGFFLLGTMVFVSFQAVTYFELPFSKNILSNSYIIIILMMTFARNLINGHACYIRSFKSEKHALNAIITGVAVAIVLPIVGKFSSSFNFIIAYASVVLLFSYPHSRYIFTKFRNKHGKP
ncbi:hypothetical protein R7P07_09300 [Vibrio sp. Vb2133]|uniref:hypothetical protein n=1 Tax=Vibrio TaxID=662 RepID=UPI000C9AE19D|nr:MULTISPECIES: hypothetical protein [Vibrio]MCX8824523.1 hypothetical protein [Vibrio parahaemolyticus]MCX8835046.1 hypothetical protein [Vibrio parahaemolyticus]MCX8931104.1 hypothetical protein [Vibrio parahaemolyticus]MDF4606214.1 hypothetical protein [Vibrio parahaemolyticus]MDF4773647.1 hypothetical protein [Vibrio parahaemolyticus]